MLGRRRIFLLSPARSDGERAAVLLRREAEFPLAQKMRSPAGAPLGEVFTFLSGLYFRGKLTYARTFARPPANMEGTLVITPDRGLWPEHRPIRHEELRAFSAVDIHQRDHRFRRPLERDALALWSEVGASCDVVLLGSVATGKYVDVFVDIFGEQLLFPSDFVGRGDMSRGGLLLRAARAGEELPYCPVLGAERHGPRPPKLSRIVP